MINAAISIRLNKLLTNNKSLIYRGLQGRNFSKTLKVLTYRYLQIISNKGKAMWETKNTDRMCK